MVNDHADLITVSAGQAATYTVKDSSLVTGTNNVAIQWEDSSESAASFLNWEVKKQAIMKQLILQEF